MFLGQTTKWGFTEISRYLELNLDICGAILDLLVSEPLHPLLQNDAVVLTVARLIIERQLNITRAQQAALAHVLEMRGTTYNYAWVEIRTISVIET